MDFFPPLDLLHISDYKQYNYYINFTTTIPKHSQIKVNEKITEKNANYSVTMVNPMSATSTCISRIIMDPLLVFCTAFHFNYELGKYQITEKFYQTLLKLIKDTRQKERQFTVAFYTGFTTVECASCFSGILYRKVAARTPHVPIKKKFVG